MKEWNDIERQMKASEQHYRPEFREEYWDEVAEMLDEQDAAEDVTKPFLTSSEGIEFKEEYWNEMQSILVADDRKKKRIAILWWSMGATGIIAILFFFFMGKQDRHRAQKNNPIHFTEITSEGKEENANNHDLAVNDRKTKAEDNSSSRFIANNQQTKHKHPFHSFSEVNTTVAGINEDANVNLLPPSKNQSKRTIEDTLTKGTTSAESRSLHPNLESLSISSEINTLLIKPNPSFHFGSQSTPLQLELQRESANKSRRKRNTMYGNSGIALSLAPSGNATNVVPLGNSVRQELGISGYFGRIQWQGGFALNYLTGINHDLKFEREYYGTARHVETDLIEYKAIAQLGIPLRVSKRNGSSSFGLGIIPTMNLSVNSTYTHANSIDGVIIDVTNNFGIREGIEKFDVKIELDYRRYLRQNIALGIRANFGLLNQIDPSVIQTNTGRWRTSTLGFYIHYDLIRF